MLRRIIIATALLISTAALADDAGAPPPPAQIDAGAGSGSSTAAITVGSNGAVAPAKGTPADKVESDPSGTAKQIMSDVKAGNWRFAISGVLAVLFAIGIRTGSKIFGTTDRGKAIAVMALALLGTFSAALATSTPISFDLVGGAIGVALTAVGGRQWLSRLLWPRDDGKPVATWLQPWLGVKPGSDTGGGTGTAGK